MKKTLLIAISVLFHQISFANDYEPACPKGELVQHKFYSLCYQEEHELASWATHKLTYKMIYGRYSRKNNFQTDPLVSTESAKNSDYEGSGYDRGHLVPAANMTHSRLAMDESFYLSNMAPQTAGFNRGIWKKLEHKVRSWVSKTKAVYVINGPVLTKGLKKIGRSRVSVPRFFYSIVFDDSNSTPKMIAFLLPNHSSSRDLTDFVVSVDEIEKLTGYDFFKSLQNDLERDLESEVATWKWPGL